MSVIGGHSYPAITPDEQFDSEKYVSSHLSLQAQDFEPRLIRRFHISSSMLSGLAIS